MLTLGLCGPALTGDGPTLRRSESRSTGFPSELFREIVFFGMKAPAAPFNRELFDALGVGGGDVTLGCCGGGCDVTGDA